MKRIVTIMISMLLLVSTTVGLLCAGHSIHMAGLTSTYIRYAIPLCFFPLDFRRASR